ncbi:hypothetical protein RFI_03657, partial [Reticulomyxa filosa]
SKAKQNTEQKKQNAAISRDKKNSKQNVETPTSETTSPLARPKSVTTTRSSDQKSLVDPDVNYLQLRKDDIKNWEPKQTAGLVEYIIGTSAFNDAFIKNQVDGISIFSCNRGFLSQNIGMKDQILQTKLLAGLRQLSINGKSVKSKRQ